MLIRIIETGEEGQHQALFPETSFPESGPSPAWLEEKGCEEVTIPPYVPTPEEVETQTINTLSWAVQSMLDSVARQKNYDGILSACSYATSTNPTFAAEAQACVEFRDACWSTCYAVMAEVKLGNRPVPTSEELLAEMPTAPW